MIINRYKKRKYAYGGYSEPTLREQSEAMDSATVGAGTAANPIVGGLIGLGQGIGKPIRTNAESVDQQGRLTNRNSAQAGAVIGGLFDPMKALQTRSSYKGGWTDITGKGYVNALEAESMEAAKKANEWEMLEGQNRLRSAIGSGYSQTGYKDVMMRKYGGRLKYGNGGVTNPQYEVEGDEVIEGQNVELEGQEKLASNMTKAIGPSHENGGVDGTGGEVVYSDRMEVSKQALEILNKMGFKPKGKPTSAAAAEFIAKKQKVYEDLLKSDKPIDNSTGKSMLQRIEQAKEIIFQDQEGQKEAEMNKRQEFAYGGYTDQFPPQQNKLKYQGSWGKKNPYQDQGAGIIAGMRTNPYNSTPNQNASLQKQIDQQDEGDDNSSRNVAVAGWAINSANYFANLADINKLKTHIDPTYATTQYKSYTDRSGVALNRIQNNLTTASRALRYSSSRSKNAAIGNMVGQSYDASNQVINAENLRRDAILGNNVDISNNASLQRTTLSNQYALDNMNRGNEKIATKTQARNAFLDGTMKQMTEARDTKYANDKNDADTQASQAEMKLIILSNQNGVADRLAASYGINGATPQEIANEFIRRELTKGKGYKKYGGYNGRR